MRVSDAHLADALHIAKDLAVELGEMHIYNVLLALLANQEAVFVWDAEDFGPPAPARPSRDIGAQR